MDNAAKNRLKWVQLYQATGDAGLVCRRRGISRPTLRKWLRRYAEQGEQGLISQSKRPKSGCVQKILPEHEQWILALRKQNLGARRIQNELKRQFSFAVTTRTIQKVLNKHAVEPLQRTPRDKKPKRYQKAIPGERVQMDTCKIRPGLYLYTAVDDCTRYLVVKLYPRRTAANTRHFLVEHVLEEMHFPIQRLQTDNGKEFTAYEVQDLLAELSIKFRPIRPRTPRLNGKVERVQKTVLTEFFALHDLSGYSLQRLDEQLAAWQHYYNWERQHGSIGQPPVDKVGSLSEKTPFWDEIIDQYDPSVEAQRRTQQLVVSRRKN